MLNDGSPPRVELRVTRWSGLRYRLVLESSGSAGVEGQPVAPVPTVTMTLENEVLRGSADPIEERRDGAIVRMVDERTTIADISIRHEASPAPVVEGWNRGLLPFRGTTSRQLVTESGAIDSIGTELVGGSEPPEQVRKSLDGVLEAHRHFPFRLPPVPVGLGARWRFREKLVVNGVAALQVSDMSLRSIDADSVAVSLAVRQEAPKQDVPHPFAPGQKATVEAYRSDGDGEIVIDRLTGIPRKGRIASTARLMASDDQGGTHRSLALVWTALIMMRGAIVADETQDGAP